MTIEEAIKILTKEYGCTEACLRKRLTSDKTIIALAIEIQKKYGRIKDSKLVC